MNSSPTHPVIDEQATITDASDAPDAISSKEFPPLLVIEEQAMIKDSIDVVMCGEPKGDDAELLFRICGLYRLLDLISEQGSGGAGMINTP